MNKYSALLLLGAANAANSPLPDVSSTTTFPKYPALVALVAGDLDADNVKPAYQQNSGNTVNYGIYVGIRNGLGFGITQSLKTPASTDQTLATAAAAGTRSFYQITAAAFGTMPPKTPATGTVGQPDGATYCICKTAEIANTAKCAGGLKGVKTSSGNLIASTNAISYRVVTFIGNTTQGSATHLWKFNSDVLLASVMQVGWTGSTATTDGTKWCSDFKVSLKKDGTKGAASATNGLNGKSKCTFQFLAEDNTVGPTITFTSAAYVKTLVQWVEWLNPANLGTDAVLPATSAANYHIGDFATTGGVFINPLTAQDGDTVWKKSVFTLLEYKEPSKQWAGSRGVANYYSQMAGVFKDTQISAIESGALINAVKYKNDENSKYDAVKKTYESDKTKYNDAVTKENDRLKDVFKAAFDPAVKIPTRPTNPSPPAAYKGPYLALDKIISSSPTAWELTAAKQGNAAYIKFGTGTAATDYQADIKYASRLGYICLTSDNSKVGDTTTLASSGRVFGRLGQGTATLGANTAPFYYGKTASGQVPGMMISLLPNVIGDAGLDATAKKIEIEAKAIAFDVSTFNAPSQPSKAADPMSAGAQYLSAGIAAATLVAASLY